MSANAEKKETPRALKSAGTSGSAPDDMQESLRVGLEEAERQAQRFAEKAVETEVINRDLRAQAGRLRMIVEKLRKERLDATLSARETARLRRDVVGLEEELQNSDKNLLSVCEELNLAHAAIGQERAQLAGRIAERTEELQLERDLLRTILETSPDGIIIVDGESTIRNLSPTAERMFGFTASELRGQDVAILFDNYKGESGNFFAMRARVLPSAPFGLTDENLLACRKDGAVFSVDLAVGETHFEGHQLFIGFVRDVTRRKQRDNKLRKLYADLAHAGRLVTLGEMTTAIAHEINQPLTAIQNYAMACGRLIDEGNAPLKNIKTIHDKIISQVDRMDEIVRHFRVFVGRGKVELTPTNLNAAVESALPLALVGGAEAGISTDVRLAKRLPNVSANPLEIQQVVLNLVRNAIEAMAEEDQRHIVIKTRNLRKQRCVEFSVQDSGHGLKPEVAATLFHPFVSTKERGMGIGLSLCHTIIDNHGGRIWAESNPTKGATFFFTLPAMTGEKRSAAARTG